MRTRPAGKTTKWLLVGAVAIASAITAYWIARASGWSTAGTVVFVAAVSGGLTWAAGAWVRLVPVFVYRNVARSGVQAPAVIVEVWRTGSTTHDRGEVGSELKLVLDVVPSDGERYRARTKTMVTTEEEGTYRPGAAVVVRYHPDFPRKVYVASVGPDVRPDNYSSPSR